MKITVRAAYLAPALTQIAKVATRRSTVPILACVIIRRVGDNLSLSATDLDIWVSALVPVVQREGESLPDFLDHGIAVDAKTLSLFVSGLSPVALVHLRRDGADDALLVYGQGADLKLQTLPAGDFPRQTPATPDGSVAFALSERHVAELLGRVQHCISTEETRYYLNGVLWHVAPLPSAGDALHLTAAATDGHRLAETAVPVPPGAEAMPMVIIHRSLVSLVLGALAADHDDVPVIICKVGPKVVSFAWGGMTFSGKPIDGTYPEYRKVVAAAIEPDAPRVRLTIGRERLLAAMRSAAAVCEKSRDTPVKLRIAPDGCSLTIDAENRGASVTCAFAPEGVNAECPEPALLGLQHRYLAATLDALPEGCDVSFDVDAKPQDGCLRGPVLIRASGDPHAIFVIMPMRVY